MNTKTQVRRLKKTVRLGLVRLELMLAPKLYDYVPRKTDKTAPPNHVLIAAPGNGNIGDQAMLWAFLENTRGTVAIVARDSTHVEIPEAHKERVRIVEMPRLIYGMFGLRYVKEVAAFRGLLGPETCVSVVGADVMDGAYNNMASVRRSNMAMIAARSGQDTRILGFSLNASPTRESVSALMRASQAGARLFLRDPVSYQRALRCGLVNCIDSSDIVFSSGSLQEPPERVVRSKGTRPRVLVNISAHIQATFDQVEDYVHLVRYLVDSGFEVVLVPHVSRKDSDDIALAKGVEAVVSNSAVMVIEGLLSPANIRSLCASAELVITGRMHLAIMALSQSVPAIVLASQGKVEGLVRRFRGNAVEIMPCPGMSGEIESYVKKFCAGEMLSSGSFEGQLDMVRTLSHKNFR